MIKICYFMIGFMLSSLVFGSTIYYPLENDDTKDGCLDYVEPGKNHIIGDPDTIVSKELYYLTVFNYEFEFYLPEYKANTDNLVIKVHRSDGFNFVPPPDTSQNYNILAKINNRRSFSSSLGRDMGYELVLYPDEHLNIGQNTFSLANRSDGRGRGSFCPEGIPKDKPGICIFRICGFYPELRIETSELPIKIDEDKNFTLDIEVLNPDEVEAGTVTIKVVDSDFYVSQKSSTYTILANDEAPFNEVRYMLTLTPKKYSELESGLDSVPKRVGTIVATFEDVEGKERSFERNLGVITVQKVSEEVHIGEEQPVEEPIADSPQVLEEPVSMPEPESGPCLFAVLFPLLVILVLRM